MKTELYPEKQLRPILSNLITAQAMIENLAGVTDIFQIRESNPKLYRLYMDINECLCNGFDLEDN